MSDNPFADHAACLTYVKTFFAERGIEVTVSRLPPIVPGPYEDPGLTCPHGVRLYAEPASDQIAEWIRDGVA